MEIPQGLKYSKEHEWVATEDTVATVGITDHAQDQLGEIVYIELPAVGDKVSKDDPFGVVESVKAVSDIYAPVTGTVIEINEDLPESPETVNEDPYGDGWLIKVKITDTERPRRPDGHRRIRGDARAREGIAAAAAIQADGAGLAAGIGIDRRRLRHRESNVAGAAGRIDEDHQERRRSRRIYRERLLRAQALRKFDFARRHLAEHRGRKLVAAVNARLAIGCALSPIK